MTPNDIDRAFEAFRVSCGLLTILIVFASTIAYLVRVLSTIKHKLQNNHK